MYDQSRKQNRKSQDHDHTGKWTEKDNKCYGSEKAVTCTSIKNVPKKLTLKRKRSYQLKPVINPIACIYKAKYKTSNKKIVKVTSKGKITAVKKGKAKITVMVGKRSLYAL